MGTSAEARAIKKASKKARSQLKKLDAKTRKELVALYIDSATQLEHAILSAASSDGLLALESLNATLDAVHRELNRLSFKRGDLLEQGLSDAVSSGSAPFILSISALAVATINRDAVRYVQSFLASDGLQLSDRIWNIDNGAREAVSQAIQRAIIQGQSAFEAAQAFVQRGERVPLDVASKIDVARASKVAQTVKASLLRGSGNPMDNALRLFRTELNRAHGEAYQAAAFAHPDVIGTRFLLSPNHRVKDICDMHASVNRHGLGKGVYPDGQNPWPAHPNTLSFVEVVFADEVSESDKKSKEGRIQWLKKQPAHVHQSILGKNKAKAFQAGHLEKESDIQRPWKNIKARLKRKGFSTG